MKFAFKIWFFVSIIFCQQLPSKAEYFLSNKKNLDKLDEKISTQIKKELNKIENKINEKFVIPYFSIEIKEAVTERVITSSSMSNRNKDILFQATLQNPNMTEYEYENLKQQLSQNTYGTREISPRRETIKSKTILLNKITFSATPKWEDVVEFYGGYSELVSKNINKADWQNGKFMIDAKLTGIEFISETECLAIVDISGDLKLNKVPKRTYKYKGNYAVEDFDIYDIYRKRSPDIVFTFKDKKYMGTSNKFTKPINSFVDVDTDLLNRYSFSIDMMFDDLISNEVYNNIDDIKAFRIAEKKRREEARIAEENRREESRIAEENRREKKRKKAIINEALTLLKKDYNQRYVWRGTDKNNVELYEILKGVKWVEPNFFNEKKSEWRLLKELDEMKNYYEERRREEMRIVEEKYEEEMRNLGKIYGFDGKYCLLLIMIVLTAIDLAFTS